MSATTVFASVFIVAIGVFAVASPIILVCAAVMRRRRGDDDARHKSNGKIGAGAPGAIPEQAHITGGKNPAWGAKPPPFPATTTTATERVLKPKVAVTEEMPPLKEPIAAQVETKIEESAPIAEVVSDLIAEPEVEDEAEEAIEIDIDAWKRARLIDKPGAKLAAGVAYADYVRWTLSRRGDVVSQTRFGTVLKSAGAVQSERTNNRTTYQNVVLRSGPV